VNFNDLRKHQPGFSDATRTINTLDQRSPREAVIMAGALLENALEHLLVSKFQPLDGDRHKALFSIESGSPLSTFGAKTNTAFAMGLISENMRKDLSTLISLRNLFAHSLADIDFDATPITSKLELTPRVQHDEEAALDRSLQPRLSDVIEPSDRSGFREDGKWISGVDHHILGDQNNNVLTYVPIRKNNYKMPADRFIATVQLCWFHILARCAPTFGDVAYGADGKNA